MKIRTTLFATTLLSGVLLASCHAKTSLFSAAPSEQVDAPIIAMPQKIKQTTPAKTNLVVTARALKAQFDARETVELQIEVKNVSGNTETLNFKSGQNFDFSATPEGETQPVWSYAMNKRFMQSLRSQQLEAGKSLQFSTTWPNPAPGRYTIRAWMTANGGLQAAPFEIVVN